MLFIKKLIKNAYKKKACIYTRFAGSPLVRLSLRSRAALREHDDGDFVQTEHLQPSQGVREGLVIDVNYRRVSYTL